MGHGLRNFLLKCGIADWFFVCILCYICTIFFVSRGRSFSWTMVDCCAIDEAAFFIAGDGFDVGGLFCVKHTTTVCGESDEDYSADCSDPHICGASAPHQSLSLSLIFYD